MLGNVHHHREVHRTGGQRDHEHHHKSVDHEFSNHQSADHEFSNHTRATSPTRSGRFDLGRIRRIVFDAAELNVSLLADADPQLTLSAEPPEGLEIEFEKTAFYVEYNTNVEVSVKIEASEDIEPGDYTIPIKVRSNSGHYDTIEVGVTVLPYIDIIINEVTVSDTLPDGGDNVVFTVSVTNMGESPTGEVTCAIYNKDTNERMASEVVSLSANETTEFDVNWTAVEGAYSFRVFISSPANEKITANNYYFLSMKVGPAFMPVDLGEEYFSEGLVYFESKKWQEAIDMFNLAIVEFQEDGEDNKVTTVQSYLDISSKYLEAHNLYNEGIDAMEAGDIALAKEKLRAAETIYTELGDLEKINLCFDQIISLNEPEEDANPKESSFLPYPWYTFTVPLLMIIVFLGYTSRSKPSTDLNALLLDLERMYEKGQISEGTYVKEKYKIKLKMLEKNA